jgi:hypothetical protein
LAHIAWKNTLHDLQNTSLRARSVGIAGFSPEIGLRVKV